MANGTRLAALCVAIATLATAGASRAEGEDTARGRELWALCASCHGADGGGNEMYFAPAIAGLPAWYLARQLDKFHSGVRGTDFDDLTGMRMRPMALWLATEADRKTVAAYAAALPPTDPAPRLTGGDAARGQALYAPCTACHGPQAKGMEVLGAPPLDHQSDWYMLTQLQYFKKGIRGAKPGDIQGGQMRPMAMLLPDEQAMKDVIAYILSLRSPPTTAKE